MLSGRSAKQSLRQPAEARAHHLPAIEVMRYPEKTPSTMRISDMSTTAELSYEPNQPSLYGKFIPPIIRDDLDALSDRSKALLLPVIEQHFSLESITGTFPLAERRLPALEVPFRIVGHLHEGSLDSEADSLKISEEAVRLLRTVLDYAEPTRPTIVWLERAALAATWPDELTEYVSFLGPQRSSPDYLRRVLAGEKTDDTVSELLQAVYYARLCDRREQVTALDAYDNHWAKGSVRHRIIDDLRHTLSGRPIFIADEAPPLIAQKALNSSEVRRSSEEGNGDADRGSAFQPYRHHVGDLARDQTLSWSMHQLQQMIPDSLQVVLRGVFHLPSLAHQFGDTRCSFAVDQRAAFYFRSKEWREATEQFDTKAWHPKGDRLVNLALLALLLRPGNYASLEHMDQAMPILDRVLYLSLGDEASRLGEGNENFPRTLAEYRARAFEVFLGNSRTAPAAQELLPLLSPEIKNLIELP